ncbi:MAG TPA: hypothetical protein VIH45_09445 [Desulfuromonadaceae bacterium]
MTLQMQGKTSAGQEDDVEETIRYVGQDFVAARKKARPLPFESLLGRPTCFECLIDASSSLLNIRVLPNESHAVMRAKARIPLPLISGSAMTVNASSSERI